MKCRVETCPGDYERKAILFRGKREGQPAMIDEVPALVCRVCGDTVLEPHVLRHIEVLLRSKEQPAKQYPVFVFSQEAA
jgi:YgiT-type zinc finger domain-containing protein